LQLPPETQYGRLFRTSAAPLPDNAPAVNGRYPESQAVCASGRIWPSARVLLLRSIAPSPRKPVPAAIAIVGGRDQRDIELMKPEEPERLDPRGDVVSPDISISRRDLLKGAGPRSTVLSPAVALGPTSGSQPEGGTPEQIHLTFGWSPQ
jgi:hypothetical protein